MVDMFGGGDTAPDLVLRATQAWTPMEKLASEFEAIGFYLSGHPLDNYQRALGKLGVKKYTEFEAATQRGATAGRLAGIVIAARERRSQKGNKFAFAMFSDMTGQFEAVIFSDTLAVCRDLLEPGTAVIISVEAERDGDTLKMRVQGLESLDKAASAVPRNFKIVLDRKTVLSQASRIADLKASLKPSARGGEVRIVLPLEDRGCEMEFLLPGRFEVSPQDAGRLSAVTGVAELIET